MGARQQGDDVADIYWKKNKRLLGVLLATWTVFGVLIPFVFVEAVNRIPFFGFKLGFWIAQQGAIYVFLALIIIYAREMTKIERALGLDE